MQVKVKSLRVVGRRLETTLIMKQGTHEAR